MCNDVKKEMRELLLKKARGFEIEEKEIILDKNKKDTGRVKITKKYIPPDTNAIKTIIRLKQSGEW